MAQEQLVPTPPSNETMTGTSPCADPDANSPAEACLSLTLANKKIKLVRFLKFAIGGYYNKKEETFVFLENYEALSTKRQYESNRLSRMTFGSTHHYRNQI